MKRWRIVQLKLQGVAPGHGQRRQVLVLRCVKAVEDLRHVEHGAHIHAVVTAAGLLGVRHLRQHVAGRARGELLHHARAAAVVEHQAVRVLHQARRLLLGGLIETLRIDLDIQAARQQFGLLFHRLGITAVRCLYRSEISIQPRPIQARLVQVL